MSFQATLHIVASETYQWERGKSPVSRASFYFIASPRISGIKYPEAKPAIG
ncbi:hypothetical protein ALT1644_390008 [Alteromonas macleodii]